MRTEIIPASLTEIAELGQHAPLHSAAFTRNRDSLLSELRAVPGLVKSAKQLNPDTVYKLVAGPEGTSLKTDAVGNIKGVFYDNKGRIAQHARFKAITPSLAKAATSLGSQVLLISIAMQLNRIERGLQRVFEEFHGDRIATITGAVKQLEQALVTQDKQARKDILLHCINELNIGVEQTTRGLKNEIRELPSAKKSFWDNWGGKKTSLASTKFQPVRESFYTAIFGMQSLAECFSVLGEPEAASKAMSQHLDEIRGCNLKRAWESAQLIPARNASFPEQPLRVFLDSADNIQDRILESQSIASNAIGTMAIEIKPTELLRKIA